MIHREEKWTTNDQKKIYGSYWLIEKPKAIIGIVHGLGEHCRRYDHVATYFNQQGYSVLGYDRHGHGRSDGPRGHASSYEVYLDEIDLLLGKMNDLNPAIPALLYGHSMGGQLVLLHVLQRQPNLKALISSAPVIRLAFDPPAFTLILGKLMRQIFPGFSQPNGLDPAALSHDPEVVKAYIEDPLVHNKVSTVTALGTLQNAKWLDNYSGQMPVPTLLMHGQEDKITSCAGTQDFHQRVGNTDFKMWEGSFHEIHNELNKAEVLQFTSRWVASQL